MKRMTLEEKTAWAEDYYAQHPNWRDKMVAYLPWQLKALKALEKKRKAPKVNKVNRSYGRRLDGRWDWSVAVWFDESFFASVYLKSVLSFETKDRALADMAKVLKTLNIEVPKSDLA